jgi:5,10-methylenetetrahydrofolate reductase
MARSFPEALARRPLLFEPVPPSARSSPNHAEAMAVELVRLLRGVPRLDAIDVPELIDENHDGRPYYRSGDTRGFAKRIADEIDRDVAVNKVVAHLPSADAVTAWVRETTQRGIRNMVLVGGSSRYIPYPGPSVIDADRISHDEVVAAGGLLGNIAIPQRTGEAHRMLTKTRAGAQFFTTQIVFDSESVLRMLREYDLLCRQSGLAPAAVVLSVAPIADEGDAEFVRWLGADIPEAAERTILGGDEPQASQRSIDRALTVFREVRDGSARAGVEVSVGINVEQISQRHLGSAGEMLAAFARVIDDPPAPPFAP